MRRNVLIPLVLLVMIAIGIALYLRRGSSDVQPARGSAAPAASAAPGEPDVAAPQTRPRANGDPRGGDRARRDALRAQIVQQLAQQPPASAEPAPPRDPTAPLPPGNLQDRIGGRRALVEHLNHDFMPLASECIEEAKLRTPRLTGMVGLAIETLSDDTHGGVVDVADRTASNTVQDPELLECIRESAYSLSIPAPLLNGREKFELTLPIDGDDAGTR